MIKFFRNIRRNILSEGMIWKYFKYAVGEIFLVVIGILIALQINIWNEGRKETAFEMQTLRSFKQSLEADLSDIEYNIERHKTGLKAYDSIIGLMESSAEVSKDSLAQLFAEAFYVTRFVYSTSTFESLKSKGVNIISNKLLQKKIIDVYDSRYRFFAESESDYINNYWMGVQTIFPGRFEEGLKYNLKSPGIPGDLRPVDFEALKKDQEFIYYFRTNRNWTEAFVNLHYMGLRADVIELLELIDQELERRRKK